MVFMIRRHLLKMCHICKATSSSWKYNSGCRNDWRFCRTGKWVTETVQLAKGTEGGGGEDSLEILSQSILCVSYSLLCRTASYMMESKRSAQTWCHPWPRARRAAPCPPHHPTHSTVPLPSLMRFPICPEETAAKNTAWVLFLSLHRVNTPGCCCSSEGRAGYCCS